MTSNKSLSCWDAMQVQTRVEADAMVEELTRLAMEDAGTPASDYYEVRAIQLSNIGYMMGYMSRAEIKKILLLYPEAKHPIFGRFEKELPPEVILNAGIAMGRYGERAARDVIKNHGQPPEA